MARNSLLEFFIHEQVNERRLNKWEIEWARTRENAVRRGAARRGLRERAVGGKMTVVRAIVNRQV